MISWLKTFLPIHDQLRWTMGQNAAVTTSLEISSENNGAKQTANKRWTLTLKTMELRPKGSNEINGQSLGALSSILFSL